MDRQAPIPFVLSMVLLSGCFNSASELDAAADVVNTSITGIVLRDDFLRTLQKQGFDCANASATYVSCWKSLGDAASSMQSVAPGIRVDGSFIDGKKSSEYEVIKFAAGP